MCEHLKITCDQNIKTKLIITIFPLSRKCKITHRKGLVIHVKKNAKENMEKLNV